MRMRMARANRANAIKSHQRPCMVACSRPGASFEPPGKLPSHEKPKKPPRSILYQGRSSSAIMPAAIHQSSRRLLFPIRHLPHGSSQGGERQPEAPAASALTVRSVRACADFTVPAFEQCLALLRIAVGDEVVVDQLDVLEARGFLRNLG